MNLLKKLFKTGQSTSDALTQPEREAILDLLLIGVYSDNHIALAESALIDAESETFDWVSGTSLDLYLFDATNRARTASDNPNAEIEFLESIAERLPNPNARILATNLLNRLFLSDGKSPEERQFMERVERALEI